MVLLGPPGSEWGGGSLITRVYARLLRVLAGAYPCSWLCMKVGPGEDEGGGVRFESGVASGFGSGKRRCQKLWPLLLLYVFGPSLFFLGFDQFTLT